MGISAYSIPALAASTTAFLRRPSAVPRKATVKSPVLVAVTAVRRAGKVRTGAAEMGSSPPKGVFTSRPQNCSPIWVSLVLMHLRLGEMKSSPLAPSPVKQRWMFDMNLRRIDLRL